MSRYVSKSFHSFKQKIVCGEIYYLSEHLQIDRVIYFFCNRFFYLIHLFTTLLIYILLQMYHFHHSHLLSRLLLLYLPKNLIIIRNSYTVKTSGSNTMSYLITVVFIMCMVIIDTIIFPMTAPILKSVQFKRYRYYFKIMI